MPTGRESPISPVQLLTRGHNPPYPGATLREEVLNERAAISPEMALRIEKWLGPENGGEASVWLAQQAAYDLSRYRSYPGNIDLSTPSRRKKW
jgi:plasmid maintenance system antidote protein VapI